MESIQGSPLDARGGAPMWTPRWRVRPPRADDRRAARTQPRRASATRPASCCRSPIVASRAAARWAATARERGQRVTALAAKVRAPARTRGSRRPTPTGSSTRSSRTRCATRRTGPRSRSPRPRGLVEVRDRGARRRAGGAGRGLRALSSRQREPGRRARQRPRAARSRASSRADGAATSRCGREPGGGTVAEVRLPAPAGAGDASANGRQNLGQAPAKSAADESIGGVPWNR